MNLTADVLIIGAGFSGTCLAANLVKLKPETKIILVEKSPPGIFGIAYQTSCQSHVLNVPASGMSAFTDSPTDFIDWACGNGFQLKPQSFAPRSLYGKYLAEILERLQASANVTVVRSEALRLHREGDNWQCELASGDSVEAKVATLAFGNFPPAMPPEFSAVSGHSSYISNPWLAVNPEGIDQLKQVGIVGSGLTAVDVVMAMEAAGYKGNYTLISRHGLLPLPHRAIQTALSPEAVPKPNESVRALVRDFRKCALEATEAGSDWRAMFDVIRPNVSSYWRGLADADKRQFLRHLRSYWDVHRHRIAPEVWERVEHLKNVGRLTTLAGTLLNTSSEERAISLRILSSDVTHTQDFRFDLLVNCTGSPSRVALWPSPLLNGLISEGIADLDATGMGLACDEEGNIVGPSGDIQIALFVLGVLRRGQLWESTAVPDLRKYASSLAKHILET